MATHRMDVSVRFGMPGLPETRVQAVAYVPAEAFVPALSLTSTIGKLRQPDGRPSVGFA